MGRITVRKITDTELLELNFGSKIRIMWHNSLHQEYYGVVFGKDKEYYGIVSGKKIGWEDGTVDDLRTIAGCIHKDYCTVYLLTKK